MHSTLLPPTQPPTTTLPSTSEPLRSVTVLAAVSLMVAGLSLAAYALTGFTTRDWTIAGPALLVAAAGIAGLRTRWFHLAGLVPIGAVFSVASPILAYDLARPDETSYFIGSVTIIISACASAIFGVASTVVDRRTLPIGLLAAAVVVPLTFIAVIGANPASADASGGIDDAERAAALDVEMIDVAFVVDPTDVRPGAVLHVRNTGSLPHDLTIRELDVAVFVPAGRETYVRLPDTGTDSFELICTFGDHLERGMRLAIGPG